MTQTEIDTISNVIKRLQCAMVRDSSGQLVQGESQAVWMALKSPDVARYLDTWVIPALEMLLPGPSHDPKLARELSKRN